MPADFWHDRQPGTDVVGEIYYSTNWYTQRAQVRVEITPCIGLPFREMPQPTASCVITK